MDAKEVRNVEMDRDGKVSFHPEQVRWLERMFPEVVHSPSNTPEEMYYHAGTRRVVLVIKCKVQK